MALAYLAQFFRTNLFVLSFVIASFSITWSQLSNSWPALGLHQPVAKHP